LQIESAQGLVEADQSTPTVADNIIATLKASGIRRVYGIPGDSLNGFTDALRRNGGIAWEHFATRRSLLSRHQQKLRSQVTPEVGPVGHRHDATLVDLTGAQHGYFNLFVSYWDQRRSFIVLEQDVLPTEEQFASMPACGEPWCAGTHVLRPSDGPHVGRASSGSPKSALIR
jgi:hypothetical protein